MTGDRGRKRRWAGAGLMIAAWAVGLALALTLPRTAWSLTGLALLITGIAMLWKEMP